MSPLEALSIVIQAAELAPLNRASHLAVQKAQQVLADALTPSHVAADAVKVEAKP